MMNRNTKVLEWVVQTSDAAISAEHCLEYVVGAIGSHSRADRVDERFTSDSVVYWTIRLVRAARLENFQN